MSRDRVDSTINLANVTRIPPGAHPPSTAGGSVGQLQSSLPFSNGLAVLPWTCKGCSFETPRGCPACPVCGTEPRPYPGNAAPTLRIAWVFAQALPFAPKSVLVNLAFRDGEGGAWPSRERIASDTGLGFSTVRDALRWLRVHGWIHRERRRRMGRQGSSMTTIRHPAEVVHVDSPEGGSRPLPEGGSRPLTGRSNGT